MTTPEAILCDLIAGQSTAEAIATRQRVPVLTIEAMLRRHAKDELVVTHKLPNSDITVWSITDKGKEGRKVLTGFPRQPRSYR